jgi:hypothetical protein
MKPLALATIAGLLCLCIPGCLRGTQDVPSAAGAPDSTSAPLSPEVAELVGRGSPYQFRPHSLRIFPLTRIDRDESNEARLVCHIEFKDRAGDTVKWVGRLSIRLYEPQEGVDRGLERQTLEWDVDLNDPDVNAATYDPSSRTYRLHLRDLPKWVDKALPNSTVEGSPKDSQVRLVAVLRYADENGRAREVRDEAIVRF